MRIVFALLPGIATFAFLLLNADILKPSIVFALLALSMAIGAIYFFIVSAPFGKQRWFRVFGRDIGSSYGAIIPPKIVFAIFSAIALSCLIAFVLDMFGY